MVEYNCPRCGYITKKKYNMRRHINNQTVCIPSKLNIDIRKYENLILREHNIECVVKELDELKNKLVESENKVKELESRIVNINMNKIIINLNSYDNPKIDHITQKDVSICLESLDTSILRMAQLIYFNSNHPENKSIYKTNMKNKLINYFKYNKWNVGDQEIVINTIVDNVNDALDQGLTDITRDRYYDLSHQYRTDKKFRKKWPQE